MNVAKAVGVSTRSAFGTVTPYLMVEKVDPYVAFLEKAFGAKETHRSQGKGTHVEVQIGDGDVGGRIMMGDGHGKTVPTTLFLYVQDADQVFRSAIAAGAQVEMNLQDGFAGDTARGGSIVDPFGFTWYLATERNYTL